MLWGLPRRVFTLFGLLVMHFLTGQWDRVRFIGFIGFLVYLSMLSLTGVLSLTPGQRRQQAGDNIKTLDPVSALLESC